MQFKAFFLFANYNRKFYKAFYVMVLCSGVFLNELFHSRLLKMPQNNFRKVKPYQNSLYRMQLASIILTALQFFVYFFTLIKYSYIQNEAFFLSLSGILINITVFVCYKLRLKFEKTHKDKLSISIEEQLDLF